MDSDQTEIARSAADRVVELEAELEASGNATLDPDGLEAAHRALHAWIDTVIGVVTTPALGRVTLIHRNGRRSSISSAELPFQVTTQLDLVMRKP